VGVAGSTGFVDEVGDLARLVQAGKVSALEDIDRG
jgi:hypothetical protein